MQTKRYLKQHWLMIVQTISQIALLILDYSPHKNSETFQAISASAGWQVLAGCRQVDLATGGYSSQGARKLFITVV